LRTSEHVQNCIRVLATPWELSSLFGQKQSNSVGADGDDGDDGYGRRWAMATGNDGDDDCDDGDDIVLVSIYFVLCV